MFKNIVVFIFVAIFLINGSNISLSKEPKAENKKDKYYDLGSEAFDEGQYNHAIDYFEEAIKANPDDIDAYNKLGVTYRVLNKLDQAINIYEKSLKKDSENYDAYHLLSIAYLYKNQNLKSFTYARKYLNLNPADPEAYYGIANVYSAMKDYKNARENYEKALDLYGLDKEIEKSDAITNIALTYYQESNYKQAIKAFGNAIEYNSQNAIAYYYLGLCYFNITPKNMKLARENISLARKFGYSIPDYVTENLGFRDLEPK